MSPHGGVSEYHRLNGRSCGCDQDFDFDTLIQLVEATRAADLVPQCRQEYVRYLAEISHRCVPQTLMTALSNGNGVIVPPVHTITDAVTTARNNASLLASQVAGSDEPFIDVEAIRTQDLDAAIALADRFGTFVALVTGGHVTKGRQCDALRVVKAPCRLRCVAARITGKGRRPLLTPVPSRAPGAV